MESINQIHLWRDIFLAIVWQLIESFSISKRKTIHSYIACLLSPCLFVYPCAMCVCFWACCLLVYFKWNDLVLAARAHVDYIIHWKWIQQVVKCSFFIECFRYYKIEWNESQPKKNEKLGPKSTKISRTNITIRLKKKSHMTHMNMNNHKNKIEIKHASVIKHERAWFFITLQRATYRSLFFFCNNTFIIFWDWLFWEGARNCPLKC